MITADQLVAHAIGDYVLQSDWMANEKTKKSFAAIVHAIFYTIPFVWLAPHMSWAAWGVMAGTHFLIDRYRLARYVCYAKNFLSFPATLPEHLIGTQWWFPWSECSATGYHKDRPAWMAVWLLIIADNTMHVCINGLALKYL